MKRIRLNRVATLLLATTLFILLATDSTRAQTYPIVDTGQTITSNNSLPIAPPSPGEPFYGQDAQFDGNQPAYRDDGDGTVTDQVTGLMWVKARGEKMSWAAAYTGADTCTVGGYDDWRMPTIKELYSLIDFSGYTGMDAESSEPFLDSGIFDFVYGDENAGERMIDCQDWSATQYVGLTMMGDSTVFGVNFADGRIKGYPKYRPESGVPNELYVRYVRGNSAYGINDLVDNGDGTVTDRATGLMWAQDDSQEPMNWEDALAWVQERNGEDYLGHNDWRLPNAKELQSIVDYTRAPEVTDSPALDPVFHATPLTDGDYPWYWTGTTHHEGGPGFGFDKAVYVCFGRATGWMQVPPNSGQYRLLDVHGAGAQRSDFKTGDPADYPHGHGPQGDVVRIDNYVRLVRDMESTVPDRSGLSNGLPSTFVLYPNYPNPFNPGTVIRFSTPAPARVNLSVFNLLGQCVAVLVDESLTPGVHQVVWTAKGTSLPSGTYIVRLKAGNITRARTMTLLH